MNKYLIFRTDRIGDFLISAILIKSIKRNDPDSFINVVASENNYNYIKSFKIVDNVILLSKALFSKLRLINFLRKEKYTTIIVHDGKQRSKLISLFLKANLKIIPNANLNISSLIIFLKKLEARSNQIKLIVTNQLAHRFLHHPYILSC